MSATPWIIGGLAVGGLGVLLLRQRLAAQTSSSCATIQQMGASVGFYVPASVCGPIDAALEWVKDKLKGWDAKDAENRQLNGGIELELDPRLARGAVALEVTPGSGGMGRPQGIDHMAKMVPQLKGKSLRMKNGCVPFRGAPGWERCAEGTHDMGPHRVGIKLAKPEGRIPRPSEVQALEGKSEAERAQMMFATTSVSAVLTGQPTDPTTALHAKIGGTYWLAGEPVACEGGTTPTGATDHRGGKTKAVVLCGLPPPQFEPRQEGGQSTQTTYDAPPGLPPPGFVWVPASGDVPGHWARAR